MISACITVGLVSFPDPQQDSIPCGTDHEGLGTRLT